MSQNWSEVQTNPMWLFAETKVGISMDAARWLNPFMSVA